MKKLTLIIIGIIIIVAAVWYFKSPTSAIAPTEQNDLANSAATIDSTTNINQELKAIDVGSMDADFNSINTDINKL